MASPQPPTGPTPAQDEQQQPALAPEALAQLRQFEAMAETMYSGTAAPEERDAATAVMRTFSADPNSIPLCQQVLDSSASPHALIVAAQSLKALVVAHWNRFDPAQTVDIRNYLLNYLVSRQQRLHKIVVDHLVELVASATKMGWDRSQDHRDICKELAKLLQMTTTTAILGYRVLNALVTTMDRPLPGQSLTKHRKTAISFRDTSLFFIFQLAATSLRQMHTGELQVGGKEAELMLRETLQLTAACLGFDFIGTNPDEAADDYGTIQVPASWRPVVEDASLLQLFFAMYGRLSQPQFSARCMETLVLLASIRRSLFTKEEKRSNYLAHICAGTVEIMRDNAASLEDPDNFHHFCRLMGRMKSNYQLRELLAMPQYQEWIQLAARFTIQSLQRWEFSANSIHYLLGLWAKLCEATLYVKDGASFLEGFVPQVVSAFMSARSGSVTAAVTEGEHDQAFAEPDLTTHLNFLPSLCRLKLDVSAQLLVDGLMPAQEEYKQMLAALGQQQAPPGDEVWDRLSDLEGRLAWNVYCIGAVVSGSNTSRLPKQEQRRYDAGLAATVFQFMFACSSAIPQQRFQCPDPERNLCLLRHLDSSFLFFLNQFRSNYIASEPVRRVTLGARRALAGQQSSGGAGSDDDGADEEERTVFDHMGAYMGQAKVTQQRIVSLMLDKIAAVFKTWPTTKTMVENALGVLAALTTGYHSSRLMAKSETARAFLRSHTAADFPFLAVPDNRELRQSFHLVLGRLLFDGNQEMFDEFMDPVEASLQQIAQHRNPRDPQVRDAVIGVCYDLTGLVSAARNYRSFRLFYEWLEGRNVAVLITMLETWWDTSAVTTALLGFFQELVTNRNNRIRFEASSASSVVLFRECSKVIVMFGSRVLEVSGQPVEDLYDDRVRGISHCIEILAKALSGDFVCFGIFELYDDKALANAVNMVLKLIMSVSLETIMSYVDVAHAYFEFLEVLFRAHLPLVLSMNENVFLGLFASLLDGLHSFDTTQSSLCCQALDNVFTTRFELSRRRKRRQELAKFDRVMERHASLIKRLFFTLFNMYLFENVRNQWHISRPIFSLVVANQQLLLTYQRELAMLQTAENQQRLMEHFGALLKEIKPGLEDEQRNAFTANMVKFRVRINAFCVPPANLYDI